ncbi:3-keto-5-aminohexanoate cleavage protein [Aeromicrobium senzhongii]|uniref:3-keto-5-aminohexanoate cleavage protein n=1 Tax=Aeromicrobium senzhongii TaxID=2663859 RepID=A0ABX6SWF0_9ACTN|nr:3-keto-5-aminohexanoate cleavage protein [Aeromicrobium senzhongii]MTB87916.1 hypothetical protein [Aeromicrobium senzhongii]QNL95065.1 3-keto-5-aminohexanoate cleavage protein [Aeromicrobium senzhongii]
MGGPILIQACINGALPPAAHPALPVTPARIAQDVAAVVSAGADAVHLHAKGDDGLDTLDPDTVDAAITAVRVAVPALPVSVTTGAWALPDPVARLEAISAWSVLPDVASVNWHEPGSVAIVEALFERDVGVEAGLWTMDDVRAWADSPVRDSVSRVLLELPDRLEPGQAVALADAMIAHVRKVSVDVPILLHGEGASAWPALRHALVLGLETRIGLEDTLLLPDGSPAADNAALVGAARELVDRLA